MTVLNREVEDIQNPSLGGMILWRFIVGYRRGQENDENVPLPLLFLVLPTILHSDTEEYVKSTNKGSGLRYFAEKFSESRNSHSDILASIHSRALKMRDLTAKSIGIGISAGLFIVDVQSGTVRPLTESEPKQGVERSVARLFSSGEKLGEWCSKVTMLEVSNILKVVF